MPLQGAAAPSELDDEPTLALTYGEKAFGNPWPVSALKGELRTVEAGLAIGPMLLKWHERWHAVLWFRADPRRSAIIRRPDPKRAQASRRRERRSSRDLARGAIARRAER